MLPTSSRRRPAAATAVGALLAAEAATFLIGAVSHLGVAIPLGFGVLREPRIADATVVESLCGLALAAAAGVVLARRRRAWAAATAAHAVAAVGVLLGIGALAAGLGPATTANTIYHRTILVVLLAGLALLQTPPVRAALGRR